MNPDRWPKVKEIFEAALAQPSAQRAAFLAGVCDGDEVLRREVESLLKSHEQAGSFMEAPAMAAAESFLGLQKADAANQSRDLASQTISHYRVIKRLGVGGMGEVYLAHDTKLDRKVALKILPADIEPEHDRMRRFVQEAKTASALNHPNIITIHEIETADSTHFIATEFVNGETLRQRLTSARLTLREALEVGIQVASALAAAHKAGIIHRDIKPENIMIRGDGIVKVLDFGLAKLTEHRRVAVDAEAPTKALIDTEPGMVLGTPQYMSPEQARGLEVDARTDIWSLGCVLYEMVTGAQPFAGATKMDVLSAILNREADLLVHHLPEAQRELEHIVSKALRKDKEERYQTVKDMLIDLKDFKHELELRSEVERSVPPELRDRLTSFRSSEPVPAEAPTADGINTTAVATAPTTASAEYIVNRVKLHKRAVAVAVVVTALTVAATLFWYFKHVPAAPLTDKDTILVADFTNTTGDAVFDGTLKQALAVQLGQSPFLNIFPEERVHETLRYMNRSVDERISRDIGREICERQGIKAMLIGSISSLGSHYAITLEAVNAQTGDAIAREQVEAESKEQVLKTLGEAATKVREKLGESLASIQKFDVPLVEATTSSLEALRAFSFGDDHRDKGEFTEAISFYKRAVELDPNFASAYQRIGTMYRNVGQSEPAIEFCKKAFELRDRVTERERYHIDSIYYQNVTKQLDKAIEVMELWRQTYPRDPNVRNNLAYAYLRTGQYEKAIEEASEGLRLNPNAAVLYSNLAWSFRALGRYDEAKATIAQAHARNLDFVMIHRNTYLIAFAQADSAEMQRQLEWTRGKPSDEPGFLNLQSATEVFSGRFREAQETVRRAVESAQSQNANDWAANITSESAASNALVGNCQQARTEVANASAIARGGESSPEMILWQALALALCGDGARAQSLIDEVAKRESTDTDVNAIWIPVIRATIETNRGNAAQAIQLLQKAKPYEMGQDAQYWPAYARGQAYLRQGSAQEAMAEFQKIIDRRSVSPADSEYPLAHLGLARAAVLSGDTARARKAYQDFLALWKDADADIPILIEAKKEYEKLK